MNRTAKILIAIGGATTAFAGVGIAAAGASTTTAHGDIPITGEALELASEAALAEIGGGQVTETEMDDEDSKYEVEITTDEGTIFEVQLDADFNVVSVEDESHEGPDDD